MARSRRGGGRRTDYEWQGSCGSLQNLAESNLTIAIVSFEQSFTLMRSRGSWLAVIDGPTDQDLKCVGAGLIIVFDEAFAAGVAAVLSPTDDLNAPWLWHDFITLNAKSATQEAAIGSGVYRGVIDSKAMRKVHSNETLIFVVDGINLAGTPFVDVSAAVRILVGS